MPNYRDGKIYTVRFFDNDKLIYIGSTTQSIAKRFYTHKRNLDKTTLCLCIENNYNNDWSSCYYELYENYPCNSKEELHRREGEIIREFKQDINNQVLNKSIAGQTKKEYRENNKEFIAEINKIYRQNNKETLAEKYKKYYENNREGRAEIDKQKHRGRTTGFRDCRTCGKEIQYIPKHIRCVDCYKKFTNYTKPVIEVEFIDDD